MTRATPFAAASTVLALALGGCGSGSGNAPPLLMFGRTGLGPAEFSYPRAIAISPAGELFVVDKAARIQAFSPRGEPLREWRMPEFSAGKPTGFGFDASGRLYVADTHYARVLIFDSTGRELDRFGSYGDGPGQFRFPTDVAVDRDGNIYVSEYGGNDRIDKFSPLHEFQFSFNAGEGGGARFERPQSLIFDREGALWVTDACNHRVCRFAADGRLLSSFGRLGERPGELRFPYGIDVLADGTLVISEYGNNRVQRFDAGGRSLGIWGHAGRKGGELAYPWALAAAADDRLYVVDSGNNRVQAVDSQSAWRTAGE